MKEAYPLQWPIGWNRTKHPALSRFGTHWDKPSIHAATQKLITEIRMLGGKDVIISTDLKLKQDGLPYSSQKEPEDRGAAVYFKWNKEDIVIACDTFNKIGCNLWAMAKTIEAMRGIDRWGCSELLNRAFSGFKALPESTDGLTSWWDILEIDKSSGEQDVKSAFRLKAKTYHPDNPDTGDSLKFKQIKAAYEQALSCI